MSRYLLCLVLLATALLVPEANAALIASWSGDGNANDSVAGRNGTLINGATFDSGYSGQAFRLDGSNDYVSVADDNVWTFGANPFTISLWANFDVVKVQTLGQLPNVFIGHSPGPFSQNKWVFFYDDNGNLAFHINDTGGNSVFLTSPTLFVPTLGEWHHVAVTRSGSTYTFYADGVSLGTASSAMSIPNASGPLTIGQAENLGFFDGRLDEIQIYNEALSASQIGQLAVPEPASLAIWSLSIVAMGVCASRARRCRHGRYAA